MMLLRLVAYLIALVTYPFRYAFYVLHAFLYFLTKPGAAIILPMVAVAVGYTLYANGNALLDDIAVAVVAFFRGLFGGEVSETIHAWRGEITAVLAFLVVQWIVGLLGAMLRPFVHALPAPRRPFTPLAPLTIPKHVIRTEPASVVVKPPGRSRYRGNLVDLQARLPGDIQAVLNARPAASAGFAPRVAPAPAEASAAQPSASTPPDPPEPGRGEIERAPASPRPSPPGAARVPGRRPAAASPEQARGE